MATLVAVVVVDYTTGGTSTLISREVGLHIRSLSTSFFDTVTSAPEVYILAERCYTLTIVVV